MSESKGCCPDSPCCLAINEALTDFYLAINTAFATTVNALVDADLGAGLEVRLEALIAKKADIDTSVLAALTQIQGATCDSDCCSSAADAIAALGTSTFTAAIAVIVNVGLTAGVQSQVELLLDALDVQLAAGLAVILSTACPPAPVPPVPPCHPCHLLLGLEDSDSKSCGCKKCKDSSRSWGKKSSHCQKSDSSSSESNCHESEDEKRCDDSSSSDDSILPCPPGSQGPCCSESSSEHKKKEHKKKKEHHKKKDESEHKKKREHKKREHEGKIKCKKEESSRDHKKHKKHTNTDIYW